MPEETYEQRKSRRRMIAKMATELVRLRRQMRKEGYMLWDKLPWIKKGRGV